MSLEQSNWQVHLNEEMLTKDTSGIQLYSRLAYKRIPPFNIPFLPNVLVRSIDYPGKVPDRITIFYDNEKFDLLPLDPLVRQAIYLVINMKKRGRKRIDCAYFTNRILYKNAKLKIINRTSELVPNFARQVSSMDILSLDGFAKSDMLGHSAVYIGKGLFLSIYGKGGSLHFSTIDDFLKTGWGTFGARILRYAEYK